MNFGKNTIFALYTSRFILRFTDKLKFRAGMVTYVGFLHEAGHDEPWYIAMDTVPNEYKVRDYEMRCGIENMFSDFKSRGFSIMKTQLRFADRLARLILVLSMALHWAVSVGLWHEKTDKDHSEKRGPKKLDDPVSSFLKGVYALSDGVACLIRRHELYGFV